MICRTIAAAAFLVATASATSPSLRGQETQLDDMEVDASVLRARTVAEFEERRRRLEAVGGGEGAAEGGKKPKMSERMYRASFSTPVDSHSTMVVRGKCVQWVQKPEQFTAIVPPGFEAESGSEPEIFENENLGKFNDFDFGKLCSRGNRESGDATRDCGEMLNAVRSLGTAALSKARFCDLKESLPCAVPNMDDVAIRVKSPKQPFGDPDISFKVKSVEFEDCSVMIEFESPTGQMSAWSTVEITALFPDPGTASTDDNKGKGKKGHGLTDRGGKDKVKK